MFTQNVTLILSNIIIITYLYTNIWNMSADHILQVCVNINESQLKLQK